MKAKSGFTLVEILIVVVILGILAAIVIPQFTNASTQAKEASMRSNLQSIRAQIQLFKIKNDDGPPAVASFETQMTGTGNGGPYLQCIPKNPYTGGNTVVDWDNGSGDWELDPNDGSFRAGDATHYSW
jgi:type II secretion system protein G